MTVDAILLDLSQRGVRLSLKNDQLSVSAPKGILTPELRDILSRHKSDLLSWLRGGSDDTRLRELLPQITPAPHQQYEPYPLADLQVGFYMGSNEFMEYHVRPHYYLEINHHELDVERYQQAWHKALQRHIGSLVTVTSDIQLQAIKQLPTLKFRVTDLRGRSETETTAALEAIRGRMSREELPIDRWPWLDWQITHYGDNRVRVHFNTNNFFSDGYGTQKLLSLVSQFYANPQLELPPLELTFRDCVLALRQVEESALGQRSKDYWMKRLPGLPRPPFLPQLPNMNTRCRSWLVRRSKTLPPKIWRDFKAAGARHGLTPTSAIYAVYAEILGAWGNSQHFIVSNMVTHRFPMHPQVKEVIGNFASLYPLEVDLRGDVTFAERAQRLQQQVFTDLEHVYCSSMVVLQELNRLQGEVGRAPCPLVVGSGLFMESWEAHEYSCLETSQTQLDHQFWELNDESYYVVWDLLEEFFPAGMIDDMWRSYLRLIELLSSDPLLWENKLLPLTPADQVDVLRALNQTEVAFHLELAHEYLAHNASRRPTAPAVVAGATILSNDELFRYANRVGRRLRALHVRPNTLVAIVMEKGWEQIVAVFGILTSGAAYVPIDPRLPPERLHSLLVGAEVEIVLTQTRFSQSCVWPDSVQRLCVDDATFRDIDDSPLPSVQKPADLAYVIFTSGSTGVPKGVMIDHRGAINTVVDVNRRFHIGPQDRIFGISSLSFDLSVYDILGTIAAGATLVLPQADTLSDPVQWREIIERERVTVWNSVPALMQLLMDSLPEQVGALQSLRVIMLSGDWIPVQLPDRIRRTAPDVLMVSLGGATEASIWSIFHPIVTVPTSWVSIPYGRPLSNQQVYVLNSSLEPCPYWVAGQLYIGGIGLALGYWRDTTKTAASFITHPRTGERLYKTGDLGRYYPAGYIEFLGREDFQVKINGYRIELGEIESVLTSHSSVSEAIVAVHNASGGKRLVAYVVAAPTEAPTAESLSDYLSDKLADYMVPATFLFLGAMPLTANGKVNRTALPAPDEAVENAAAEYVAPRDEVESELTKIWQSLLELDRPIGVRDDFFGLGGQSFTAIQVLSRTAERFDKRLSLGTIMEGRTIEHMAQQLRLADSVAWTPLVCIEKGTGQPYIFVHPAGGHVMCYRELAKLLGKPFYALQAAGIDGNQHPLSDVPQMAQGYITALRQVQAHGPYLIGGWSSGGVIAFEMARQLEAAGEHVDRLYVLDCPSPIMPHPPVEHAVMLRWFIEDLNIAAPLELIELESLRQRPDHEQFDFALARFREHHFTPAIFEHEDLRSIFGVFKATVAAAHAYPATPINADIVVLRASTGVVSEFSKHPMGHSGDWGWSALTAGNVRSAVVPGSHYTILTAPGVARVADILSLGPSARRIGETSATQNDMAIA